MYTNSARQTHCIINTPPSLNGPVSLQMIVNVVLEKHRLAVLERCYHYCTRWRHFNDARQNARKQPLNAARPEYPLQRRHRVRVRQRFDGLAGVQHFFAEFNLLMGFDYVERGGYECGNLSTGGGKSTSTNWQMGNLNNANSRRTGIRFGYPNSGGHADNLRCRRLHRR